MKFKTPQFRSRCNKYRDGLVHKKCVQDTISQNPKCLSHKIGLPKQICLPHKMSCTEMSSAQFCLHRNVFRTILPEQKCLPHKMSCTEMSSTQNVLHRNVFRTAHTVCVRHTAEQKCLTQESQSVVIHKSGANAVKICVFIHAKCIIKICVWRSRG